MKEPYRIERVNQTACDEYLYCMIAEQEDGSFMASVGLRCAGEDMALANGHALMEAVAPMLDEELKAVLN